MEILGPSSDSSITRRSLYGHFTEHCEVTEATNYSVEILADTQDKKISTTFIGYKSYRVLCCTL